MLVAYRLAGLSALEPYYEAVRAHTQFVPPLPQTDFCVRR